MPTTADPVTFDRHGFQIAGRRCFLRVGTVPYFRIDRGDWAERLHWLKAARFNAVDVYVPWNYHEPKEGNFDFTTDNRDLPAFLRLCAQMELMVYLRPGPYICNEWDGGGLPAWLYPKPALRLRQNDPTYLQYVRRYLHEVNRRVRGLQIDSGGPIILYALENELDFFRCEDPAGYIGALRDMVREDGITVPLAACIGKRDRVAEASGFADGVIPSPNIYTKDLIERKAADAAATIHASRFQNGAPMADLPVFITEMGRDENSLRRMLAGGVKGLGPFNFAGGSHFGFWNGTNNWGPYTQIASVVDFGGMIGFDGRVGRIFADARRLAGLIEAFEPMLLAADSITSWEGGPAADHPQLGAIEDEARPGRLYSLVHGDAAFVFVPNTTDAPLATRITKNDLVFPIQAPMVIPAGSTRIALINVPLTGVGLDWTIAYATAELSDLSADAGGPTALFCGDAGAEGELRLVGPSLAVDALPPGVTVLEQSDEALTLAMRFDEPGDFTVTGGGSRLNVRVRERFRAGFDGIERVTALGEPTELAAMPWRWTAEPELAWDRSWIGPARAMESLGVLRGAGWYEFVFDAAEAVRTISFDGAGDIMMAQLDGVYLGTALVDGGTWEVTLPAAAAPGRRRLTVRAEIWGHPNFHDARWPACHLGSLRGLQGSVRINGQPAPDGRWRFAVEAASPPAAAAVEAQPLGTVTMKPGVNRWASLPLPRAMDRGAVVSVQGRDCHGELFANDVMIGRFAFGPTLTLTFKGGPGSTFYLPPRLASKDAVLHLHVRGAGEGGAIEALTVTPRVEIAADALEASERR